MSELVHAAVVPELLVNDLERSLSFWIDLCGFDIAYRREAEGFVYLDLDGAQFMLEEMRGGNYWVTGPLQAPLGRGINFEIRVSAVEPIVQRLTTAAVPLFRDVQEAWYRKDAIEVGVRQFLVQDPDGYLLRFSAKIGERPAASAPHTVV